MSFQQYYIYTCLHARAPPPPPHTRARARWQAHWAIYLKWLTFVTCNISDYHSGIAKDSSLLECNTVPIGEVTHIYKATLSFETSGTIYPTTLRNNPWEMSLCDLHFWRTLFELNLTHRPSCLTFLVFLLSASTTVTSHYLNEPRIYQTTKRHKRNAATQRQLDIPLRRAFCVNCRRSNAYPEKSVGGNSV
jgi:hypothetical protein